MSPLAVLSSQSAVCSGSPLPAANCQLTATRVMAQTAHQELIGKLEAKAAVVAIVGMGYVSPPQAIRFGKGNYTFGGNNYRSPCI